MKGLPVKVIFYLLLTLLKNTNVMCSVQILKVWKGKCSLTKGVVFFSFNGAVVIAPGFSKNGKKPL